MVTSQVIVAYYNNQSSCLEKKSMHNAWTTIKQLSNYIKWRVNKNNQTICSKRL